MRWNSKSKPNPEKVQAIQQALQVDEIIATLLVQRGIETFEQAKTFFRPTALSISFIRYGLCKSAKVGRKKVLACSKVSIPR